MCRLMAVPPQMSRGDVLDILLDMETRNTDGFGFAYVKDKKFIANKTRNSLSKSLKKKGKDNIFASFPEQRKGWAILHLRAASQGDVSTRNAHPFLSENYAFVHNGMFREHLLIRAALSKDIKYTSETDSEVALHLLEHIGPKKFAQLVEGSSVYLALCRDGSLWAFKTSFAADLKIAKLKQGIFLASELPFKCEFDGDEMRPGWAHLSPEGEILHKKEKGESISFSPSNKFTGGFTKSHHLNDYADASAHSFYIGASQQIPKKATCHDDFGCQ